MSMWDGIENADSSQKLPYLKPGTYTVELISAAEGVGKLKKQPFFKVTFKVILSKGENSTPADTVCVWVTKKDAYDYYLRDIKNWAAAVLAMPAKDITAFDVQGICTEPEAVGSKFDVQVDEEPKKNGLGNVTKYRFFATPDAAVAPF